MPVKTIELGGMDVAAAAGLVLMAGGVSLLMGLGVGRRLLVAAVRSLVQLGLAGLVLRQLFALNMPLPILAVILAMVGFAGREAAARSRRRYPGMVLDAWLSMLLSCLVMGGLVTQVVLKVKPWFDPRYVVPLLGMILGNSLNGVALCLDRLRGGMEELAQEAEMLLAFGATRWEAYRKAVKDAVRTGMIPIINSMSAAGLVFLPGLMTGQILAGAPPMQAVAYQLVVLFMLSGAAALASMVAASVALRRLIQPDGIPKEMAEKGPRITVP